MAILKSVKKAEGSILGIAALGILGGIALYAVIKGAPAIGNLFTAGINSIVGGITSGINSATSAATSPGGVASQPQPTPANNLANSPNAGSINQQLVAQNEPTNYQQFTASTPTQQAALQQSNPTLYGSTEQLLNTNIFAPGGQYSQLLPTQQANIQSAITQVTNLLNVGINQSSLTQAQAQAQNLQINAAQSLAIEQAATIPGGINNLLGSGTESQPGGVALYSIFGKVLPLTPEAVATYQQAGQHPVYVSPVA